MNMTAPEDRPPVPTIHEISKLINSMTKAEAIERLAAILAAYGNEAADEWAGLLFALSRYPNGVDGRFIWNE